MTGPVDLDPDTGRLRLTSAAFAALYDQLRGSTRTGPLTDALASAGLLDPGSALPGLRAAVAAVGDPMCRLAVRLHRHDGRDRTVDIWVDADTAALLLPLDGERHELATIRPDFVPAVLARLTDLGPRQRYVTDPIPLTVDDLDALLSPEADLRRTAAQESDLFRGHEVVSEALVTGPWLSWVVEVTWPLSDGRTAARGLHVLDSDAGLFWVEPRDAGPGLVPTSARDVWRVLTNILPSDEELDLTGVEQ